MRRTIQEYPPCSECGFVPNFECIDLAELMDHLGEVDEQDLAYRRHIHHTTRTKLATTSLATLRRRYHVSVIRQQFGSWAVTSYGLECLTEYYPIEKRRLRENWQRHMAEKTWVLMEDFAPALQAARELYPARVKVA